MDFKELKIKTEHELHKFLSESREKLRELRFKDSNHQLKNVREIRNIKKIVARVLTLLKRNNNETKVKVDVEDVKQLNK